MHSSYCFRLDQAGLVFELWDGAVADINLFQLAELLQSAVWSIILIYHNNSDTAVFKHHAVLLVNRSVVRICSLDPVRVRSWSVIIVLNSQFFLWWGREIRSWISPIYSTDIKPRSEASPIVIRISVTIYKVKTDQTNKACLNGLEPFFKILLG